MRNTEKKCKPTNRVRNKEKYRKKFKHTNRERNIEKKRTSVTTQIEHETVRNTEKKCVQTKRARK